MSPSPRTEFRFLAACQPTGATTPLFPEIFEEDEDAPKYKRCQTRHPCYAARSRALCDLPRNTTCWHAPRSPFPSPPGADPCNDPSRHRRIIPETKQKNKNRAEERPYYGWQGNSNSELAHPPRAEQSPPFAGTWSRARLAVALRYWAFRGRKVYRGLGHRRADTNENVELECASSRGTKKRTLAQVPTEEAPAPADDG
jgi:hypothetical protein